MPPFAFRPVASLLLLRRPLDRHARDFNGLAYVQQIRADATLRFGLDRYVDDLEYDFVDYAFPQGMSPMQFDRLLRRSFLMRTP